MKPHKKELKKQDAFKLYTQTLSKNEADTISSFFTELDRRIALSNNEKTKMRMDFKNALIYYNSAGVPLHTALERLNIENLGGFYIRPSILWFSLDDSAKIYPLSMKHGQMAVFRLSVYLKHQIVPELLQIALTFTVKRFPTFATTVKKGFFWHYLETAKHRYSINEESDIPCQPLKISRSGSQSFRVLYYNNRISIEYFHVLTDGSGGMVFLKTLTAEYLRLLSIESSVGEDVLDINEVPSSGEAANEFSRAEKTENASGFIDKPAVQMSGKLSRIKPCRILHFKMDAASLKAAAKTKNATVTAYILALMFVAGKHATDELEGNINIQVPVNMRKYYSSSTLRNFTMYCGIKLEINNITDVGSIIEEISLQLGQKASKQSMTEMMNSTKRTINAIKYIPLFIKAPVTRIVCGYLGDMVFSSILSNLGVIKMPRELEEHIDSMDFILGSLLTNRASCALVTYNNFATLSIAKMTADPSFEEKLFNLLAADGIIPVVEGSELYEN